MRGFMQKVYHITDEMVSEAIRAYLAKHPKARKEQTFKHCTALYGAMDHDDFSANWKAIQKER